MSVSYKALLKLLIDKDIKPNQLVKDGVLSRSTMLKITKGDYISLEVLEKICVYLNCGISDVIEFISNDK